MKERGRQRGCEHAQRTITQTLLLLSLTVSSLLTCTSSSTSSGVFFLWFAGTEALTRPNALLMRHFYQCHKTLSVSIQLIHLFIVGLSSSFA